MRKVSVATIAALALLAFGCGKGALEQGASLLMPMISGTRGVSWPVDVGDLFGWDEMSNPDFLGHSDNRRVAFRHAASGALMSAAPNWEYTFQGKVLDSTLAAYTIKYPGGESGTNWFDHRLTGIYRDPATQQASVFFLDPKTGGQAWSPFQFGTAGGLNLSSPMTTAVWHHVGAGPDSTSPTWQWVMVAGNNGHLYVYKDEGLGRDGRGKGVEFMYDFGNLVDCNG
jgi:hypothetical protein